ncbi:MAG: hypothetical protein ACK521_04305, partial [bacterium]
MANCDKYKLPQNMIPPTISWRYGDIYVASLFASCIPTAPAASVIGKIKSENLTVRSSLVARSLEVTYMIMFPHVDTIPRPK